MALGSAMYSWTIVLVDVADFTNPGRTAIHRQAVQAGMYAILEEAFGEAGIGWGECVHESRGDGVMVLVPTTVPKNQLADRLPGRLLAALRRYNAVHTVEAAIAMRAVLHYGEITRNSSGADGRELNNAFRMLDCPDAKARLRESGGMLAVIASAEFYWNVISEDPAAEQESYREIRVRVKKFSSDAWLRVMGIVATDQASASSATVDSKPLAPTDFVHDLLPEPEWKRVHGWLVDVDVPNLVELARRAAGSTIPLPRLVNPWHVFTHLADFNSSSDGVPPSLLFLDALANQIGGEMGRTMTDWIDEQARRLTIGPALRARRAVMSRTTDEARLHLEILIDRDAIDRSRYLLSFWRQETVDEWPPARGAVTEVSSAELERVVDDIVVEAERAWASQQAAAVLEFLLPRPLLGLPVHRWHKEHDSGDPRPLCLDYQIRVRSLERMRSAHWHRLWRERWRSMLEDPSPARIHFLSPGSTDHRVDALLSDPHWVSMVLTAPGSPRSDPGMDALTAALRSGLPVLMWHPDLPPEKLHGIVDWFVEGNGLIGLPQRADDSRRAALGAADLPIDVDVARDVVVLWDDPMRLVALDGSV